MGLKDKRGIAVLFDAMMFLAVMIAVSAVVLYSLSERAGEDDEVQDYVASVHRSLLRCHLSQDASSGQVPLSISDICQQGQVSMEEKEGMELYVQGMLEKCFGGRSYRWTVNGPGFDLDCSFGRADGGTGTSYVSTIVAGSGPSQTLFALTLYR